MSLPFQIACRPPHLVASFDAPQRMLSWSLTRPGFQVARRVAWLEVRNADLPASEDPIDSLNRLMADADLVDAISLITSRDITRHHLAQSEVEGVTATALATVGLSNGERVGQRLSEPVWLPGTINILLHVSCPLSEAAFIETLSIVTQARTAAVLDAQVSRAEVVVTGTGTDCIVVAAPQGADGARFAGLHTAVGEAAGDAVYRTVREGVAVWQRDFALLTRQQASAAE
ncbi:adenosylcobinamide amidohydrolase [Hyphomicrobium sp.]|uniref:adenosylcobinamide amidohydrolase n=1 Tax=Hyphomicrobium sp. TaxID=82 RepID=UPI0025B7F6AD|nr:adenosylcobinamide amidohydrolase [Hyphomicrobium sp.]MCC7254027.1 adenosylcobinamide amidohydrolase [Hyphomicrobium sp.]